MVRTRFLLPVMALLSIGAAPAPAVHYPETRRVDVVESPFGEPVADPWRWLEGDVRTDAEVADWVRRENDTTTRALAALPERDWFARRIGELAARQRFGLPRKAAGFYFYAATPAGTSQPQLWMRRGLAGKPRLLLGPGLWSGEASGQGAFVLDATLWEPSPRGRLVAFGLQASGSDWRTIRLVDTRSGALLPDRLDWANDTRIAWVGEAGFLYSRYPAPEPGREHQAPAFGKAVWFHRPGTPQAADQLVYATPDHPERNHVARVTSDGRHAVILSTIGTDGRSEVHVIDLARRHGAWPVQPLVSGFDHRWDLVDGIGGAIWFVTDDGAPRGRLVALDPAGRLPPRAIVAENDASLVHAALVGRSAILSYQRDGQSQALVLPLTGGAARQIILGDYASAAGFRGRPGDSETFFTYSSFARPPAVYRYDLDTGAIAPFAEPDPGFAPSDYAVEQVFVPSKDGTRVPMYLVRRRDIAAAHRPVPTLLYGYGGFGISVAPSFSPARMAWLEAGGAFALAGLRGGGEYGRAWHDAGRLAAKQNVFDDFIAAAEWLVANGVTPSGGLAIQGASNGGLLVGAAINQRPDLFAAANPEVGVMDMLRFDRFTAGRFWVDDYGHPDLAADWKVLRAYSPYHNVAGGREYPAILVTTADTDDRVVPAHSFKYAAALQAADIGNKPHLLRVETGAGHASGTPLDNAVAENAEIMAFLAHWTGLVPPASR